MPRRITIRPRALPAAVCSSQAPGGTRSTYRVITRALAGLTKNIAACSSGSSRGTGTAWRAGTITCSCQLPVALFSTATRRPSTRRASRPPPDFSATPTPSKPGVIGSATASEQDGYDGGLVVSIAVTLQSSGAVDNLSYCPNGPGAQAVVRNGSGGNPTILRPVSLPVIGRTWRANLDCSAYDSGVALVVVSQLPSAGTMTPFGEALIAGAIVHRTTQAFHRSASPISWSIPFDLSLCGLEVHAQGSCRTSASPFKPKLFFLRGRLSNAVDLVLGF